MSQAPKFLLIFAVFANAATLDLSAWKYRKRIPLTPGDGLAVVKLDREVYAAIGNRPASLRVVRNDEEVPYVFDIPAAADDRLQAPTRMFNQSVVPGSGLQFTLHMRGFAKHNRVFLGTRLKNFRKRVRVETSQDGTNWAIARDDGAIFNFSQDGREFSSTAVDYPVSTRPFLRVTVFGWTFGAVTDATIDYEDVRPAAFEVLATLTPQVSEDTTEKSTIVVLDLGMNGLPVSRIVLETASPQFQRAVGIETSDDGAQWSYLGSGTIARLPGPEFTQESLVLHVSGERRFFRLSIHNRDDKPIEIGHVRMEGLPHRVKFLAANKGTYWLYYGNPGAATMPEYDLRLVLAGQTPSEHVWTLDRAEQNPSYRAPGAPRKPWSEQHPAILYTVLGGAVLALGIATFRFAARLRPSS